MAGKMNNMDGDQCNIDEIQALLDDQEEGFENGENKMTLTGQEGEDGTGEESDDDIDEDELDKLAQLVESETQSQYGGTLKEADKRTPAGDHSAKLNSYQGYSTSRQDKHDQSTSEDGCVQENKTPLTKVDKETKCTQEISDKRKCKQSPHSGISAKTVEVNNIVNALSSQTASTAPEEDVLVKLNELSAMEEQIRLMKSKLLEKAKQVSPEVVVPKMKLLEEDIFKPSETSTEPKNTQKAVNQHPAKCKQGSSSLSLPAADSDSDWDDLDGEKPTLLSKEGKQLKKLLSLGPRDRMAHAPKHEPMEQLPKKKPYNSTWTHRPGSSSSPSASSCNRTSSASQASCKEQSGVINEPLSGIRIINPLVSSVTLKSLMSGRKMIRLSHLHKKVNTPDLESDWVTIGVMVSKSEPRKSAKGNQYSIWRLSDLDDCDKIVSLFLFNKVFQELWKTSPGTVIGILNPNIMQSAEKSSFSDLSITIDNPKKLLILGKSKDLGRCKSKTKAGNDCINFINLQKGEYCTYHVQAAYKKTSAKRSELQAGFTGVVPKAFEKTLFNRNSTVMYGGHTYTTNSLGGKAKSKKKSVTIKSLQSHHVNAAQQGKAKITTLNLHDLLPEDENALKNMKENKNDKFHDALCVPTVGSLNYVKHMMNSEKVKEVEKSKPPTFLSISAKDLLKSREKEMQLKRAAQKRRLQSKNKAVDVVFDFDATAVLPRLNVNDVIKQRAIKKVQKKGGIKKEDPNAVKKPKSPSEVHKIKERLNKSTEDDTLEENAEPPRKRSKILGNLDLESSEIQHLLKARSKHDNELSEQEREKHDQYFEVLEKKEKMEEKMSSVTEVKCKAFICKQCKYRAMSIAPHCREQKHEIITSDAIKKFFECKDCKQRTITIERYPHHPCRKCQGSSFIRCSMFKEKKGPQLSSETLCLRGDEIKFLNSLN